MQTAPPTSDEQAMSAVNDDTVQRVRCWETTYTTVDWDYPISPTAYYDALLSRGAPHSRFLRIAYSSTRERASTSKPSLSPTSDTSRTSTSSPTFTTPKSVIQRPPAPPCTPSRPYVHVRPRSANPPPHTLKRRKPYWPKPPQYHASLLRSPLSHRKGLFRAVLPPNKADFFRWDVLVRGSVSLSAPRQKRDQIRVADVYACPLRRVAESVLEPYEAAAGFFGWHGVGLDVIRRVQRRNEVELCREQDSAGSSDLQLEIDEATVDEGKARWARTAEELVGPPGLASRWVVVEDGKSEKVVPLLDPTHKQGVDVYVPSSMFSDYDEVRWDLDIGSTPRRPSRPSSAVDKKRSFSSSALSSKVERKPDAASAWWHGPLHRGPPPATHLPSLRFPPPPPPVQYGPPPMQFSSWFPGGRAQGHGYWYGTQPIGAPPSMNCDPNHAQSLGPHSHVFPSPTSMHPSHSPRQHTKSFLGRDEHEHDRDKETEDHDYESTTTTTDSDPPPHTPIGATTVSHCVDALQVHGDDEVDVDNIEIDGEHAAATIAIGTSDPATPVKLLDRCSVSTSPSVSPASSGSYRGGPESSKAAVVFPSLNGSFRQGSLSQFSVSSSSQGMSVQTTPARTVTPASSVSLSSGKESARLFLGEEVHSKMNIKSSSSDSSASEDGLEALSSPPPASPGGGFRKDSQGFWEPVNCISPSSSSSSLPLSPIEGKLGSRHATAAWISEERAPVPGESATSPGSPSLPFTPSAKARSLSPGPRRASSTESTPSSSRTDSLSPPASASAYGGPDLSSPSPPNRMSDGPANPTTLLPAFLATANVKRKKTSRTREIIDRLRSSSVDAGKGGMVIEGLGWQAGPSAHGEMESTVGKGSDHAAVNHVMGGPSPSPPSKTSVDVTPGVGAKTQGQATVRSSGTGLSVLGGKNGGATLGSDMHCSQTTSRSGTTTVNSGITPFPILSVSQPLVPQGQAGTTPGRTAMSSHVGDGLRSVTTSPVARSSGLPHLPNAPGGSSTAHTHHHPHPSPTRPVVGPPPAILAVSPYPHPVYVPFAQYRLGPPPPHQAPQGQGTWVSIYPGRPPLPVHPLPAQPHVPPITGASGMRHVSW